MPSWLTKIIAVNKKNPKLYDTEAGEESDAQYFAIGHGDFDEQSGTHPGYIVWVYLYGNIETSDIITVDEEGNPINDKTHGVLWGHDVTDKTYKGRYEPDTGRLSIVCPSQSQNTAPQWLIDKLFEKFDYISDITEF